VLADIYALKGEQAKALEQINQARELVRARKGTAFFLAGGLVINPKPSNGWSKVIETKSLLSRL
jgi:hypothetical protein